MLINEYRLPNSNTEYKLINIMSKHFSNSKQMLHLAREYKVTGAEIIQLSIASLPLLGGSLTNTESMPERPSPHCPQ